MKFQPMSSEEAERLRISLVENAEKDRALVMNRDTSFSRTTDDPHDEEVVAAIRSIPCHYATTAPAPKPVPVPKPVPKPAPKPRPPAPKP
jgi:hypothetical protein